MPRSEPQRSCLGCRKVGDKRQLLRFVLDQERNLVPDLLGKLPGRGAYTCFSSECFRAAVNRKQFARAFRGEVLIAGTVALLKMVGELQESRLSSYIALANKAGQVISGSDAVTEALQRDLIGVLVIAADISVDSGEKFTRMALKNNVPVQTLLDKERLGRLLGKELRSVVAIEKGKFAEVISRELEKYRNFCEGGADVR